MSELDIEIAAQAHLAAVVASGVVTGLALLLRAEYTVARLEEFVLLFCGLLLSDHFPSSHFRRSRKAEMASTAEHSSRKLHLHF